MFEIWDSLNSWFTPTVLFLLLNLMIGIIAITSSLNTQKHNQRAEHETHERNQPLAGSPSVLQRLKSINFNAYRYHESTPTTTNEKTPETNTHFVSEQTTTHEEEDNSHLARSSSLLQRLRSFNFSNYYMSSREPDQSKYSAPALVNSRDTQIHYDFQRTHVDEREEEEEEYDDDDDNEDEGEGDTPDDIYSRLNVRHVDRSNYDTKLVAGDIPSRLPKKMKKSASAKSVFAHFEEDDIVETRRPATVKEESAKVKEGDDEVDAKADDFINRFNQQLKLQRLNSIAKYKEMISRGTGK